MTTPTIVQSVFARSTGQSIFGAPFPSQPTVGNVILAIGLSAAGIPGFVPPLPIVASSVVLAGIIVGYYKVTASMQNFFSMNVINSVFYTSLGVFEIQNARLDAPCDVPPVYTAMNATTAVITTPALSAPVDSGGIRFAIISQFYGEGIPTPTPSGWTLLSPTSWFSTSGFIGGGGIWQVPNTTGSSQTLTYPGGGQLAYASYIDLQITQASFGSTVTSTRADLASGKPPYIGKSISTPAPFGTVRAAVRNTANAFYGSSGYLAQWSPSANGKSISGTVVQDGLPTSKLVQLINKATGDFISQVYSDATTGAFSFNGLNPNNTYQVIGFDSPYNAQIFDNLIPG